MYSLQTLDTDLLNRRQAAAEWARRCRQRYLDAATVNGLRAWLGADERHRELFLEADAAKQPEEFRPTNTLPVLAAPPTPRRSLRKVAQTTGCTEVQAKALDWMYRRSHPQCSPQAITAFINWLDAHPEHSAEHTRLCRLWDSVLNERVTHLALGIPTLPLPSLETLTVPQLEFLAHHEGAVSVAYRVGRMRKNPTWQRFRTPIGGSEKIELPLETQLHLDTQTSLQLRSTPTERQLQLTAGRIHLRVGHGLYWPFVINVDGIRLQVNGANFCVERLGVGEVRIDSFYGPVRVQTQSGAQLPAALEGLDVQLDRHEILQVSPQGSWMRPMTQSEELSLFIWRADFLYFDAVPLSTALREFNRYRSDWLEVSDPKLRALPLSGGFAARDVRPLLDYLQKTHNIHSLCTHRGKDCLGARVIRLYVPA